MEGAGKVKNFFTTDIPIKLLSLFLAVVLWIYVVILLNPETDVIISDIPVTFADSLALTNSNYVMMNEKQHTIELKLRGKRSILTGVNKNNISAYVDLAGYEKTGAFSLPLRIVLPFDQITVLEKKPYNINVTIDKIITRKFTISAALNGEPKDNFVAYPPTTSQNIIEVKGPQTIVESIDKAIVQLNVASAVEDVIDLQKIKLINSDGNEITNKLLTTSPEKVEVHSPVLFKKKVPIKAVLSTQPPLLDTEIIGNSEINILGKQDMLNAITEIRTEVIKDDLIKTETQLNVPLVVPNGVILEQKINEVTVKIKVKQ